MSKILVIAEVKNARVKTSTAELISKARSLGADTASLLVGNQLGEMESQLVKMGAQHQYICESPELENPSAQSLTRIIVEAAQQFQADQVWFSSNETAKATAPRVAARLSAGCVSDITDIADSGGVTVFRQAAAGKVLQKIQLKSPIGVFTVRSGAFDVTEQHEGVADRVEIQVPQPDLRSVIKEVLTETGGRIDLVDAEIVVSCGRGAKDQNGIDLIKGLADDLKAGFGSSRALVDTGLMPHESQVGQTGKVVSPVIYFAIGISGAIQHLAGMNGSKTIVAINKDPDAPIFNVADYGIVGDLFQVVPILKDEIKKQRS